MFAGPVNPGFGTNEIFPLGSITTVPPVTGID
jgi:hypothetical protein